MTQLTIVDYIPLDPVCQAPGFGFIIWYCSKPEVFRDRSLPVRIKVGRPNNGRYFCLRLLALTSWPT
jgi:hypothetical protein